MSGKRKRSSDSIRSPPDANQAQPPQAQPQAGPASKRTAPRRPKSSQACQACRKHKTRCELLDSTTYVARCHRCEVLSITCSFETDAPRSVVFNDPRPLNKGRQSAAKALLAPSKHPASPGSTPGARNGEGGADPDNTEDETESPWDFLTVPGLADWTDTPILGMRMLMRQTSPDPFPKFSGAVSSLSEVITPEQKHFLLERFAQQYEPWLSLPPNALVEDDMLDLVRCTVASRHLDPLTRSQVFPALRYLVEQVIMQHVFNPSPSIAVVQAFCILSLWSPFESLPPSAGSHDSRLIASSAVSMGKTLRLNESEDRALELQQRLVKGSRLTIEEANEYPLLMTNCSMWVLLRVVESMACIGTGRPLTATSDVELDMKRYGHISDTLDSARHTRLLLFGRIFELADKGVRIELPGSQDDYDAFYDGVEELLTRFEVLSRVILGLPVSSEFDKFYLESFSVFYQFCKLVVYVRILRLLRVNQPKTLQNNPYLLAKWRRHGSTQVIRSARSAMLASDAMLVAVLSTHEPDLLASAPDAFFSMVAFAAAFLVMAKFMLLITQGQRRIPGCTDQLLTRVVRLLGRVAPSPDHPAARCAKIMTSFIETWDARLVAYDAEHAQPNPGELLPAPRDGMGTLQPENGSNGGSSNNLPHAAPHQDHTYSHVNGQQPPPMTTGPSTSFIPPNVQLASSVPPIPMPELTDFSFRYDSASLSGFGGGGDVFGGDFWQFMAELPGAGVGAGAGAGAGGGLGDLNYMYQTQAPPQ